MFGIGRSEKSESPPPSGVAELIFCVLDEKYKVHHYFSSSQSVAPEGGFHFLSGTSEPFDHCVLRESLNLHQPTSVSLSYGEGHRKYLYVLPYERKWGKWRFACMQVTLAPPDPDAADIPCVSALAEERVCLVLTDSRHTIRSVSSRVPETFGYGAENLMGMSLQDLFTAVDVGVLSDCSADTNESILSCIFQCLDGSKREVELKKFSAPDHYMLYAICDISSHHRVEEFAEVSARERRRIGQDLHDSIGQLLTGISLLSRSLANRMGREGAVGDSDALQISELADLASNQIRQISRGLMPSEIVQHGLYESLRELARITSGSCGVVCETRIDESIDFPDVAVETHLYRIAQESVNNAVRHAEARRIDIIVSEVNGMPQLAVCDDGTWKEPTANIGGIGMQSMRYRASVIGGQLQVGPGEQGGTKVVCRLEMDEALATRV